MNNDVVLGSQDVYTKLLEHLSQSQFVLAPLNLDSSNLLTCYSGSRSILKYLGIYKPPFIGYSVAELSHTYPRLQYMDVLGFQCTFIPSSAIDDCILPDEVNLPHYHADGEWCYRLARAGFPAFTCLETFVIHDTTTTGPGNSYLLPINFPQALSLFFNIRSPRNLISRIHLHRLTIPLFFVPFALATDIIKFLLLYIRSVFRSL